MKRLCILGCAALWLTSISQAAILTPEEALSRLSSLRHYSQARIPDKNSVSLITSYGNIYVFSGDEGYLILPNDDAAPALLGYAESGEFSIDGNPALEGWLSFYDRQLSILHSIDPDFIDIQDITMERPDREAIQPLLKTEWNQEAPYNDLCPKVDGRETVTGCVATAMAQVMKFYNYPEKGKGTHSYYWAPGKKELTFDYENTPFQWGKMIDRYDRESSEEERHAVAELMLACGISVDMHYEPGGSGAATSAMGAQLIDVFDYSKSTWMPNRVFYGYDEWEEMVYSELSGGRPVLYSGAGTDGGHQFVCDGYRDGFFHFNWGWGGLSNGYFLLTALNPDHLGVGGGAGGFNSSQVATLGLRPATEDEGERIFLMYNTTKFTPDAKRVKSGENFRCSGEYFNYSLSTMPDGSRLGMKFTSVEDKERVKFVEGPGVGGFRPDDGRIDLQVRFPELEDGDYVITPSLKVDGKWSEVRMPVGAPSKVFATVSDGIAEIEGEDAAYVTGSDLDIPAVIYRGKDFHMEFTIHNPTEVEYFGRITPYLLDSERRMIARSLFRPMDVLPGETVRVTDYEGRFEALRDREFTPGKYLLVLRDDLNNEINTPVEVKVVDFITSVDDSVENEVAGSSEVYDLNGLKHKEPSGHGIYIKGKGKMLF